jgi:hypothetical protein
LIPAITAFPQLQNFGQLVEIDESTPIRQLLHFSDTFLLPTMMVKEAVAGFEQGRSGGARRR